MTCRNQCVVAGGAMPRSCPTCGLAGNCTRMSEAEVEAAKLAHPDRAYLLIPAARRSPAGAPAGVSDEQIDALWREYWHSSDYRTNGDAVRAFARALLGSVHQAAPSGDAPASAPLAGGSVLVPLDVLHKTVLAMERAESAACYSAATVAPGNSREPKGDWVEVHAGRARSSYRQLSAASKELIEASRSLRQVTEFPPLSGGENAPGDGGSA